MATCCLTVGRLVGWSVGQLVRLAVGSDATSFVHYAHCDQTLPLYWHTALAHRVMHVMREVLCFVLDNHYALYMLYALGFITLYTKCFMLVVLYALCVMLHALCFVIDASAPLED